MSKDESRTAQSARDDDNFGYAAPNAPLDYEPYRQSYKLPDWKDSNGRYAKRPSRDLGTDRLADTSVYYSRETKEQEWELIWSKVWLLVGHLNDIPRPNAFMKVDRGHESVLVVRGPGETVRAMYNVCQHRGTRLVEQDFGTTKKFVCPFHMWEFSNTGELLKIADRETFREEAICHNLDLPKVRSAVHRGWIFITLNDEAGPLEDYLGKDFLELTAAYDFESVLRIRDVQQEWPANWKTAHEAFIEGYHVQATHPQLRPAVDAYHAQHDLFDNGNGLSVYQFMSPTPQVVKNLPDELAEEHRIFLREAGVPPEKWPTHWRDVPAAIVTAKLAKTGYAIDYSRFSEGQLIDDWSFGVFPTTEMFLHPEGYFIQNWLPHPTDPEKCIYTVQVYAVPGIGELPSFMAVENADLSGKRVLPRTYIDTDDYENLGPVIRQDRELVPRVQQGLHSRGYKGAVYSEQEIRIRHFFQEYGRYMNRQKGW
jgi:phenylpropionate dioxygenase-like ring-hydroxylating dioxygenase large terminal subunit